MLSVKGTFDGKKLDLSENIKITKPVSVIITFLDDEYIDKVNEEIIYIAEKGGSFDFLNDPSEDIYTDENLKTKYK